MVILVMKTKMVKEMGIEMEIVIAIVEIGRIIVNGRIVKIIAIDCA